MKIKKIIHFKHLKENLLVIDEEFIIILLKLRHYSKHINPNKVISISATKKFSIGKPVTHISENKDQVIDFLFYHTGDTFMSLCTEDLEQKSSNSNFKQRKLIAFTNRYAERVTYSFSFRSILFIS